MRNLHNQNIKTEEYSITDIYKKYDFNKFVLPKYQRLRVWDNSKKSDLLNSVVEGFPVGSIILSKVEDGAKDLYYVLDGQQRTLTLLEIKNKPFKYMTPKTLTRIFEMTNNSWWNKNKISSVDMMIIIKQLSDWEFDNDMYDYTSTTSESLISEFLKKKFVMKENFPAENIHKSINEYLRFLNESNYKIFGVVVKNFDSNESMEIFKRLNTKGQPLEKYEVLSSIWAKKELNLLNPEIEKEIEKVFNEEMKGLGITKVIRETKTIPSDFFHSIFILIFKKYKNTLFYSFLSSRENKNIIFITSKILFTLILVFRSYFSVKEEDNNFLDESKIRNEEIGEYIVKYFSNNSNNIIEFKSKLEESIEFLNNSMELVNSKGKSNKFMFQAYSNLLISLLSQVFKKILLNRKSSINVKNMKISFLYEIINGTYSSSTNKKALDAAKLNKYLNDIITIESFENLLRSKFESFLIEKNDASIKNLKLICEILLNISKTKLDEFKFIDFSSLISEKIFKKYNIANGYKSIGNLTVNSNKDNIAVDEEYLNNLNEISNDDDILLNSPDLLNINQVSEYKKELQKLKNIDESPDVEKQFKSFLKYRSDLFFDLIIDKLK